MVHFGRDLTSWEEAYQEVVIYFLQLAVAEIIETLRDSCFVRPYVFKLGGFLRKVVPFASLKWNLLTKRHRLPGCHYILSFFV